MDIILLYNDAFNIISCIIFFSLTEYTYSPNVLFRQENTVSTIHLFPYLTLSFHFCKSFLCAKTDRFLRMCPVFSLILALFLTLIHGKIPLSARHLKISLPS